ncbi:serine/threonine protein kinase [Nonomuraea sp. NEAU-A123]|uniref:serine/threonine protein kinase n=1 Tax=Nonomuraea sp. NEAU-A123 TaxID=2839649 RepID=UPI001BE4D8CE|nr:serine/threonine protein kinase [Nonomuraea sp. NEAU-A123]MBT2231353.1 protein kinase [Nonomuraea sp. NEAU-A123]
MVAQGTTLAGRYRLDTRIGAGGMGEVWRGEDIVLARTVAVKVLLPGRMDDPGFVARFQAEARAMATINHSGVVDVYDYGVSGDTVYLVMKFVDGEPLDRLLMRLGRIPPQPAMELIAQAASALQAVHEQGIVHRDVKPGNLLVQRDGTLVLTDFGIARSDVANRLTDAGMVLGTAAYCAPEQAEGAPVTPAVDIYALGVVAYECLVGQRPFDGESAVTIALKHIREAPPPLPVDIPRSVRTLVERALSKDPLARYPTARAMSETARKIAAGETPAPEPAPVTGATMAAPMEAYQTGSRQSGPHQTGSRQAGPHQTGSYQAGPHQTGSRQAGPHQTGPYQAARQEAQTMAGPRQSGRRGAAKAPRRGGLIAGIAAAVVLGAGAGAVALTGIKNEAEPGPTTSTTDMANSLPTTDTPSPATSRPKRTPKPRQTPQASIPTKRTVEPTEKETPTPDPTEKKTPTKSPSGSPTPTVTKVAKKQVPSVVELPYAEAVQRIKALGFDIREINQTTTEQGTACGRIGQTFPNGGTWLEVNKPVKIVVIDGGPCPSGTPTPTPSLGAR